MKTKKYRNYSRLFSGVKKKMPYIANIAKKITQNPSGSTARRPRKRTERPLSRLRKKAITSYVRWFYKKNPCFAEGGERGEKQGLQKNEKAILIIVVLPVRSRKNALHSQKILRIT